MLLEAVVTTLNRCDYLRLSRAADFLSPRRIVTEIDLKYETGLKWGLTDIRNGEVLEWFEAGDFLVLDERTGTRLSVVDSASNVHLERSSQNILKFGIRNPNLIKRCTHNMRSESFFV